MEITLPSLTKEESNLLAYALDIVIRITEKQTIASRDNMGSHDAQLDLQAHLHQWQHAGLHQLRQRIFPDHVPGTEVSAYMQDFMKYYVELNSLQSTGADN